MARKRAPHWQIRLRVTSVVSSGTTDRLDERLSSVWHLGSSLRLVSSAWTLSGMPRCNGRLASWRSGEVDSIWKFLDAARQTQQANGLQFADRRAAPLLSSSASSAQQWVPPQGTARDTLMSGGADTYRTRLREGQDDKERAERHCTEKPDRGLTCQYGSCH